MPPRKFLGISRLLSGSAPDSYPQYEFFRHHGDRIGEWCRRILPLSPETRREHRAPRYPKQACTRNYSATSSCELHGEILDLRLILARTSKFGVDIACSPRPASRIVLASRTIESFR